MTTSLDSVLRALRKLDDRTGKATATLVGLGPNGITRAVKAFIETLRLANAANLTGDCLIRMGGQQVGVEEGYECRGSRADLHGMADWIPTGRGPWRSGCCASGAW